VVIGNTTYLTIILINIKIDTPFYNLFFKYNSVSIIPIHLLPVLKDISQCVKLREISTASQKSRSSPSKTRLYAKWTKN